MPRAKYWVFTLNNYTEEEVDLLSKACDVDPDIAYVAFGKEVGDQGTPHLQGHLELSRRLTLGNLKSRSSIPLRCHLKVRRGTFEQSEEYCQKDGDFVSWGARVSKGAGARTDLEELRLALNDGMPLREISNEFFSHYMRYRRSINSFFMLHSIPRTWQCSVIIYYGRTGTGKTSAVYGNLPSIEDIWVYPGGGWFDGYAGEKIVLFDDFSGSEFKIGYLLKVLDRYPMRVPIKGDFVNWAPQEIYITSNLNPDVWFPNAHQAHREALKRRFTNVVEFE